MASVDASISAFPIAAKKPTGSFTGAQAIEAMLAAKAVNEAGLAPSVITSALKAIPKSRTLTLSSYGATEGGDITAALQALNAAIQDGDHIILDVEGTYNASAGIKTTKRHLRIQSTRTINVQGLDHNTKPYLIQISGYKKHDLTITSGDITEGDPSFDVDDSSDINPDDVIIIQSTEYFNGTGASGDPICNKSMTVKVRQVVGTTIHLAGPATKSMASASITSVESWRGGNGCTVEGALFTGPGIQAPLANGAGAQGVEFNHTCDGYVIDFAISGFQNRQVGFTNCYNTWAINGQVSSGLSGRCTENFYGVTHQGGAFCFVLNVTGHNLRRVADTGTSDASDMVFHHNITGIDCNGSAAGTHHAYNYTFSHLRSLGVNGGGFTFRAKNIKGAHLTGIVTPSNNGIGFGAAQDSDSSCGNVDISGIDLTVLGADYAIKIFANGRYRLSGEIDGGSVSSIVVESEKIGAFKYRGQITKLGKGIVFDSATPTQLDNVDVKGVEFLGGTGEDIVINAPADPDNRAENITISDNASTVVSQSLVRFASGYFEGLSTSLINNRNIERTTAGTTALIDFGSSRFSVAPEQHGNRLVNAGERNGRTEATQRIVGEYDALADIPDGTTLLKGSKILIANASAGDHPSFIVTAAGTTGTLSGVTGSINAGTTALSLTGNSGKGVDIGTIVVIAGAGAGGSDLTTKVLDVSSDGSSATVVNAAGTTVIGSAINYSAVTFSGTGVL